MQLLFYALFAAGIVAADQLTKYLTVANIALGQRVDWLPGFLSLTYYQNTGAAFSSLEGQMWLFILIFVAFTLALVWEHRHNSMNFSTFDWWCIVAVYGGGLGNMIDRLRLGYVVDMIRTEFMVFPIFNVADCFITCGCIALMASQIITMAKAWKK